MNRSYDVYPVGQQRPYQMPPDETSGTANDDFLALGLFLRVLLVVLELAVVIDVVGRSMLPTAANGSEPTTVGLPHSSLITITASICAYFDAHSDNKCVAARQPI
jgi:hypothetical protein